MFLATMIDKGIFLAQSETAKLLTCPLYYIKCSYSRFKNLPYFKSLIYNINQSESQPMDKSLQTLNILNQKVLKFRSNLA